MSAAEWLLILMADPFDLWDIVPGLCPEIEDELMLLLIDEELEPDEVRRIALGAIEMATGRRWWVAIKLIQVACQSWEIIGGNLAYRGIDASRISLGAWLDAVLLITVQNMEPDKVTMFTSQLEVPPPEFADEVPEPEMNRSSFFALGA